MGGTAGRRSVHLFADDRRNPSRHSGKPRGRKRDALEAWFAGPEGPQSLFAGRVLPFDDKAGLIRAHLMAGGKAAGRPRRGLDMIIAATARANDCLVVTDNEKDFAGIPFVNPMRGAG